MRKALNPNWILIVGTVPIIILLLIFYGEFTIIKSLLKEENISLWKKFGISLTLLGIINLIYGIYLKLKKKEVSLIYGFVALCSYIPFLYIYGYYFYDLIPNTIPRWMVPGNIIFYAGTFLMPTLAYALYVVVLHLTPDNKEQKAWKNFLVAILIPFSWYLFNQVILPFWKPVAPNFGIHTIIVFIIIVTLIFLFFLIRGVYIIGRKKYHKWIKYQLLWKIPIGIVLPVLGLAINNGLIFNNFGIDNSGIFGDFNNYWFYVLAIVNGLFICLPDLNNKLYRLFLFIGRSITFAYTLYFFIVFLPFLPLSIIAIVAIGTGFLMLVPLLLFIIHVNILSFDYRFLKNQFSSYTIYLVFLLSFLSIPIFVTSTYLIDRYVLLETLDYLYNPDYSRKYRIDNASLQNTLEVVNKHKDKNRDFIFGNHIPYLSTYFNWLVLDNLTLSDGKINYIERVFFGYTSFEIIAPENIRNDQVEISKLSSTSRYDKNQNAWISWVDFEITNKSENDWFAEYATTINLPNGCWISDYYLFVEDKKEMGILAEKKSAMWVFSQIRNENKDPGILYYLTGNKIAFRVFPFNKNETRRTGIEFIHKEPVKLDIDGQLVELGSFKDEWEVILSSKHHKNVVYVSSKEKSLLPVIQRKPYFHFIVDVSKGKEEYKDDYIKRIEGLLNMNLISQENAKVSFTNTYTSTFLLNNDWKGKLNNENFEGGFYLERAIKENLLSSYNETSYPVFIILTDNIYNAILEKDFADLKFTFPENDLFYTLNTTGELKAHSLISKPKATLHDTIDLAFDHSVLAYPNIQNPIAYLPRNNQPDIILIDGNFPITDSDIKEKNWNTALHLQGKWLSQVLHPETSNKEWFNLVKYSFLSKIMTPYTSYIVVENEAQKAILKRKQEQVLSSNKSYDLGEDTQRMSEPNLVLLLIILIIIYGLNRWKLIKLTG